MKRTRTGNPEPASGDSSEERAVEALRRQLRIAHDFGQRGQSSDNFWTARNVVDQEEGQFDDPDKSPSAERLHQTFLRNGRQDSAHALLNTICLLEEANRTRRTLWGLKAVVIVNLLLTLVVLGSHSK